MCFLNQELNGKPGGSCFSPCCSVMALSCVSNLATCAAVQAAGMCAVGGAAAAAPSTAMAVEHLAGNLGDLAGSCVGGKGSFSPTPAAPLSITTPTTTTIATTTIIIIPS